MHAWLLAALAALSGLDAGVPPQDAPAPFAPGERLSYDITVLGVSAGTAQLAVGAPTVADGVRSLPLVARARSAGAFEKIFPLRDDYVSWWDPAARRAVESRLQASEGGNRYGFLMHFHAVGPDPTVDYGHWDAKGTIRKLVPLPEGALDFLSSIYWLRTRPLAAGERDAVTVYMGNGPWPLVASVVGREIIPSPAGAIRCVHLRIAAKLEGPLGNRKDLDAWFSDDARHLPVVLDSELLLGHLRATLIQIEGAR